MNSPMQSPTQPQGGHFRRLTLVDGDIKAWTASQTVTSPTRVGMQRRQASISYTSSPATTPVHETTQTISLGRSNSLSDPKCSPTPSTNPVDNVSSSVDNVSSSPSKRRPRPLSLAIAPHEIPESSEVLASAPLTLSETYAPLLHFIAQKESKCLELRSQLAQHESELAILKRKWEKIVSRERAYGHRDRERAAAPALHFSGRKASRSVSNTSSTASSTPSRSSLESTLLSTSPDSSFDGSSSPCLQSAPLPTITNSNAASQATTISRPSAAPLSSLLTPLSSLTTNFSNITIDNAVDKILYPSIPMPSLVNVNKNLNNAMDKIISPRHQKRASKVLEGVINWGTSALSDFNTSSRPSTPPPHSSSQDMPDDTITTSPSTYLSSSPMSTSTPPIEEEREEEKLVDDEEEDGWNW